jgi:hypothetical protein
MTLQLLKADPTRAIESCNFLVDYRTAPRGPLGGNISLSEKNTRVNVSVLEIKPGGTDYYFPYNTHGFGPVQGIGSAQVTNPRNGCVAVTGGMNGCALGVYFKNNEYRFVHDANGMYARNLVDVGEQVCRITADAYWPDQPPIFSHNDAPTVPICQFICVFANGVWHVGCFGISTGFNSSTRSNTDVAGTFEPKRGKYRGHFSENSTLLQS